MGRSLLAAVVATAVLVVAGSHVAGADAVRVGSVTITNADGTSPLASGQSDTVFTVRLPDGAACPGDTANDGYAVQSFMIPVGDDPGSLEFGAYGPKGTDHWPLYKVVTSAFGVEGTDPNDRPGVPGVISDLPPLAVKALEGSPVKAGEYLVGVACTLDGRPERFWDAQFVLARSTADGPQLSWTAADAPADPGGGGSESRRLAVALVGGVLLIVVLVGVTAFRDRRRRTGSQPDPLVKEST